MDIAVVGAAVNVALDASGVCKDARIVRAVARRPSSSRAANALVGHRLDEDTLRRVVPPPARRAADRRQAGGRSSSGLGLPAY
jgi:hypothetical protein